MMMIMIEVMYDDEVTFTVARRLSPWNTACIQAYKRSSSSTNMCRLSEN